MVQSISWVQRQDMLELTVVPPRVPFIVALGWFLSGLAVVGTGLVGGLVALAHLGMLRPWHAHGVIVLAVGGSVVVAGLAIEKIVRSRRPYVIRFGAQTLMIGGVIGSRDRFDVRYRGPSSRLMTLSECGNWTGRALACLSGRLSSEHGRRLVAATGLDLLAQDLRPLAITLGRTFRIIGSILAHELGLTTGTLSLRLGGRFGGRRWRLHGIDEATAARFMDILERFSAISLPEASWEKPAARSRVPGLLRRLECPAG